MRLVDADELIRYKSKLAEPIRKPSSDDEVYAFRLGENDAIDTIMEFAPTVDAIPLWHGHWIRNDNGTYSCSECKSWIPNEQHYYARYCLFCGAKMDEMEDGDLKMEPDYREVVEQLYNSILAAKRIEGSTTQKELDYRYKSAKAIALTKETDG